MDKVITSNEFFKTLNAFNKEILHTKSNRYFFIPNPVKIVIKNAPKQIINIRLHPNNPQRGIRQLKSTDEFYLTKEDVDSFKNNNYYRLMECLNFKKEKGSYIFDSKKITEFKNKGKQIIHWLPQSKKLVNVEVLMPNNKWIKGAPEERARIEKTSGYQDTIRILKKERDRGRQAILTNPQYGKEIDRIVIEWFGRVPMHRENLLLFTTLYKRSPSRMAVAN